MYSKIIKILWGWHVTKCLQICRIQTGIIKFTTHPLLRPDIWRNSISRKCDQMLDLEPKKSRKQKHIIDIRRNKLWVNDTTISLSFLCSPSALWSSSASWFLASLSSLRHSISSWCWLTTWAVSRLRRLNSSSNWAWFSCIFSSCKWTIFPASDLRCNVIIPQTFPQKSSPFFNNSYALKSKFWSFILALSWLCPKPLDTLVNPCTSTPVFLTQVLLRNISFFTEHKKKYLPIG